MGMGLAGGGEMVPSCRQSGRNEHPLPTRIKHTFGVVSYWLLCKTCIPHSLSITLSYS